MSNYAMQQGFIGGKESSKPCRQADRQTDESRTMRKMKGEVCAEKDRNGSERMPIRLCERELGWSSFYQATHNTHRPGIPDVSSR